MSNPAGGDPIPGAGPNLQEQTPSASQEKLLGPMTSDDVLLVRASVLSRDTNNPLAEQAWQNILTATKRFLLVLTADEHAADELTAETVEGLLRAFNQPQFTFHADPVSYVFGTARMRERMRGRALRLMHKRQVDDLTEALTIVDPSEDPEKTLLEQEFAIQIVNHLNDLTDEQMTVLKLKILGLTTEEMAEFMGKTPGTVRALAFRAKESLKRMHPEYEALLADKPRKSQTISTEEPPAEE